MKTNTNINTMPTLGHHIGKLVPQKNGDLFIDGMNKNNKHFRQLTIACTNGETLTPQIYDGFLSTFFTQIWRQTRGATGGLTDAQVWQYLSEHQFDIWVDINEDYAWPQYSFQEPRK